MRRRAARWTRGSVAVCVFLAVVICSGRPAAQAALVLDVVDYATAPMTGAMDGQGNAGPLARITTMREEPGGGSRFFVVDLNGPLYILDKQTRAFTTYLDFNGSDGKRGLFGRFTASTGLANGLNSLAFDPDYRTNGRFYTVHIEDATGAGPRPLRPGVVAGLDLSTYSVSAAVRTPGEVTREAVLLEWTDTNRANTSFEGRVREVLRVELNVFMHPMGEITFNPTARPGDPDWQVLYIGCGDSGSGEQHDERRMNPQRLDNLVGKILRIVPDPRSRPDGAVSDNGRYRVPGDNPFVGVAGARPEIWAYGLRNPHRLSWGIDPRVPAKTRLIAASVGLHTWESVYLIEKGANYGYSLREGHEALGDDNRTAARPAEDRLPVRITDTVTRGRVVPRYPVIEYPHNASGGDAVAGGFVYRGARIPALVGKFLFADVTTGRLWYADYDEMLRADDGVPETVASFHGVALRARPSAAAAPGAPASRVFSSAAPIVLAAYLSRGGRDPNLPGAATVSGAGRADVRLAVDEAGELYLLSKSDGMVREIVSGGDPDPVSR